MDETGWLAHWRNVYAGLVLIGPPEERHRATPSDAHLDRLEERIACRLPASYRAFVKVLGPGSVARSFTIYAPGYRGATAVDFLAHNKWQEEEADWREEPERVRQLIAFGDFLADYESFCFDTSDVTDPIGPEYRIVYCPHRRNSPLISVTDSFGSFIDDYCLGGGFHRLLGYEKERTDFDDESHEPRSIRSFWPVGEAPRSRF